MKWNLFFCYWDSILKAKIISTNAHKMRYRNSIIIVEFKFGSMLKMRIRISMRQKEKAIAKANAAFGCVWQWVWVFKKNHVLTWSKRVPHSVNEYKRDRDIRGHLFACIEIDLKEKSICDLVIICYVCFTLYVKFDMHYNGNWSDKNFMHIKCDIKIQQTRNVIVQFEFCFYAQIAKWNFHVAEREKNSENGWGIFGNEYSKIHVSTSSPLCLLYKCE